MAATARCVALRAVAQGAADARPRLRAYAST
jgi:hypothetical protein